MAERSVNKVIIVGRLGKDAETTFTPSGAAVTKFSVATSRNWKDKASGEWKTETDWTNIVAWQQEKVGEFLTKGKQVYVEGRLQTRNYENKEGKKVYVTEVVAEQIILLGGNSDGSSGGEHREAAKPYNRGTSTRGPGADTSLPTDDFPGMRIDDSDVPF